LLRIGDAVLCEYGTYKLHAFQLKEALRVARADGRRGDTRGHLLIDRSLSSSAVVAAS
jgi:hypothetical protein